MRCGVKVAFAIVGLALTALPSARAGVYISSETRLNNYRLLDIKKLRSTLQSLLLPARPNDLDRQQYIQVFTALQVKEKAGSLTDVDRADLGGLYLRFGQPREAMRVLSAGNSGHFLVLCNLAVAQHELAVQDLDLIRFREAILAQKRALAAWPAIWESWSDEQWYTYRRVELLQLRLLEQRFQEMRRSDGKLPVWQSVDDLFPGFKLVGRSGEYEAGRTALSSLDALPPDAPWLVRELMMAYPTDARLYWLFGETLNAGGRVEDAFQVCADLVFVNQMSNVRELFAHRRVLMERTNLIRELRKTPLLNKDDEAKLTPVSAELLLVALAPRSPLPMPIAGSLATEAGWWVTAAAVEELQRQEQLGREPPPPVFPTAPTSTTPSTPATNGSLPDLRVLGIGFAAGVVVTVVIGLQRAEWKRRRQAALSRRQPVG